MIRDIFMKKKLNRLFVKSAISYLEDKYIEGICPVCGEKAHGYGCDKCQENLSLMN